MGVEIVRGVDVDVVVVGSVMGVVVVGRGCEGVCPGRGQLHRQVGRKMGVAVVVCLQD